MKICKLILPLFSLFFLTSCATIMHGSYQRVGISSNPTKADVWIDQIFMGQTPILVEMPRCDNHYLRIELAGYQPYEAIFSRQLSYWVFGNVVFGGVIGLAVDAVTGAIFMLTPDQINAELRSSWFSTISKDVYIAIVLEPKPEWKKIGNLKSYQN